MCRNISTNEFWDSMKEIYVPNGKRTIGNIHILKDYGNININHFNTGSGINYSCFTGNFNQDVAIEGKCYSDSSFLRFNTGNKMSLQDINNNEKIQLDIDKCWQGKEYSGYEGKCLYTKNKYYICHSIRLEEELFSSLIQDRSSPSISKSEYLSLKFNNHISMQQKTILNNIILSNNLTDKLKNIYLESKLLDLVYTTINESNKKKQNSTIHLNNEDIKSLQKANNILLNDLINPPSLKELARMVATNEFKLKKGFKQLFGDTVYGLLQKYRLEEAKILLEKNEISVGEAANLVGYKSVGHFSKIFKEYFGILAVQVKHNSKIIYY